MAEANPLAAWRPQGSSAAQQEENPLAAFRPTSGPAPELARSVGEYVFEMISNVPGSAGQVGKDLWSAISSPVETAQALAGAAVGGAQLLKDELGLPTMDTFGDHREAASAVADHYSGRYGGGQETLDTFREDPIGAGLDIGGLLSGGAMAGARAPGVAGRVAQAITKADPIVAGGRAVGRGMDAVRNRAPSNHAFFEGAPSPGQLQTQASNLFESAEKSGVRFKSSYYDTFVDDTFSRLVDEGADTVLSPKVSRVADLLKKSKGQSPSIQQMSILRRQFGNAAGSADAAERRLASIAIDRIDSFVEGGAGHVGAQLGEARKLWSRLRKSEVVDTAIENAQTAQAGVEAGLRAEFKTLYRARDSKKMRGFSKDEMTAIKRVAMGDFGVNTLRRIGSLSGGTGSSRNMLNLLAGTGAGAAIGGPIGAAAVPLAGYGAQRAAQAMTQNRANLARAVVARGETPSTAPQAPQAALDVFLKQGAARRRSSGAPSIAAPVAIGSERSRDPRFRGIR